MAAAQDDDDIQLIRASASLLQDLEQSLPHLLWKDKQRTRVHHLVRLRDLDHVLQLVRLDYPKNVCSTGLMWRRSNLFSPNLNY